MFDKVYIVHIDPESKDYEDVEGAETLTTIPPVDSPVFDKTKKTLLILDDLEFKFMSKYELKNLDRIYGYASSHKNLSVLCLAQDAYNIPPCIRRMANIWIIGKINNDLRSFYSLAERCGLSEEEFKHIFDKYITGDHDTFWIDRTKKSPAEFRVNGYHVLDRKNNWEMKQKN